MAFNSRLDPSSFPLPSLCGDVVHVGGCFTCGCNRLANKVLLNRAQDEMAVNIESRGIIQGPGIKMARKICQVLICSDFDYPQSIIVGEHHHAEDESFQVLPQ